MPLPILAVIALGAVGGVAARGAVGKVRNWLNNGETVVVSCPRCGNNGPHDFVFIDRSWATSAAVGVLTGAVGGAFMGAIAKRVFKCKSCNTAMYKNGDRPGWNADKAVEMFVRYPSLMRAHEELEGKISELERVISRHQEIAKKYAEQIEHLKQEQQTLNLEKEAIEERLHEMINRTKKLISMINREAAAA